MFDLYICFISLNNLGSHKKFLMKKIAPRKLWHSPDFSSLSKTGVFLISEEVGPSYSPKATKHPYSRPGWQVSLLAKSTPSPALNALKKIWFLNSWKTKKII